MMKRDWGRCAFSAAMAFLLSVAGFACLLTAFEIRCNIETILFWCLLSSVIWSISYTLQKSLIPMVLYAFCMGYIWRSGFLQESINGLAFSLSGAVRGREGDADAVLCLTAVACTMNTTYLLCKGRRSFVCILFAALPLAPAFLTASATPSPLWLGIWLFGVTLLLLTQPVRRLNGSKKLTAWLVLPVAALSAALVLCLPQSAQEGPQRMAHQAVELLQQWGIGTPAGKPLQVNGGAMELKKLGPRQEAGYKVMTVKSDLGGAVYLRGCAYDTYFQNNWTNLNLRDDFYWPGELEEVGTVTVKTEYTMQLRYFPYYATGETLKNVSRSINNFSKLTEYSYGQAVIKDLPDTYTNAPDHGYTQLPTVTQRWAEGVLQKVIAGDMTDEEKITAITTYVKNIAKYNLYPDQMPAGEPDFVVWFAEKADKGYCVHFATTAAALLRCAGIPTRFVTGYMVQTKPGEETPVYGSDAHAWVECFLEGVGWIPVEATPGAEPVQETPVEQEGPKPLDLTFILYGFGAVLGGGVLFICCRRVVNLSRRRRMRKLGSDRRRLLACYSQLCQLLTLSDALPARELEALALKAKYSEHPITADNVEIMENALKLAKKALRKHSFFKKLHYKWILNIL